MGTGVETCACARERMCVLERACMRACVRACVRACIVPACKQRRRSPPRRRRRRRWRLGYTRRTRGQHGPRGPLKRRLSAASATLHTGPPMRAYWGVTHCTRRCARACRQHPRRRPTTPLVMLLAEHHGGWVACCSLGGASAYVCIPALAGATTTRRARSYSRLCWHVCACGCEWPSVAARVRVWPPRSHA